MTVVQAHITRPDSSGTLKPAKGYLRWAPVRGWSTNGNALVLPIPFRVKLVAGAAVVTVDPTTVDWAWEVTYELFGQPHEKRYYAVPNSGVPLDINTLAQVAPLTGQSAGPLPQNWSVALEAAVSSALAGQIAPAVAAAVEAELAGGLDLSAQITTAVNAAVPGAVGAAVPGAVTTAVDAAVPGAVSAELAGRAATELASVKVLTGTEARPVTSAAVLWTGGTTRPVNMVNGDVWFKALP